MHVSLSEVETTVCKAAWAVGLALGLGEEAGRTARRLVVCGLAPLAAYAEALARIDAGTSVGFDPDGAAAGRLTAQAAGKDLSALQAGPAVRDLLLADAGRSEAFVLQQLDLPLLVIGEVMSLSGTTAFSGGQTVSGQCGRDRLTFIDGSLDRVRDLRSCDLTLAPSTDLEHLHPRADTVTEDACSALGLEVADQVWRRLTRLADRRLVAASETSRLQGAGAGLVDRD